MEDITLDAHNPYPHDPGMLYDCMACEASCFCTDDSEQCVHCALVQESEDLATMYDHAAWFSQDY